MRTVKLLALLIFLSLPSWAISHVTDCTPAAATSCTLASAVQYGDVMISAAYRNGSTTPPTLAAGWTTIQGGTGANTNSMRVAYKFAIGGETTCGTWTNATDTMCSVYRGATIGSTGPFGGSAATGSSSTTVSYPALTMSVADGTSWVVGFSGAVSAGNDDACPATVLTTLRSGTGITSIATCDTNGGVSSFTAKTVTISPTSVWRAVTVELLATPALTSSDSLLVQEIHSGHTNVLSTTPFTYTIKVDPTLANNLLWIGISACGQTTTQCDTSPALTGVTDNQSNTWVADATETNASDHITTYGLHVCGATAGVTTITVTFSAKVADFHFEFKQYDGITTSSCVDGTPSNALAVGPGGTAPSNITPGAITTTVDGDLITSHCIYTSNNMGTSEASDIQIPGGSTFDSADYSLSSVDYSFLQTTHGAISPFAAIVNTNAQNFNCIGVAFKTAAAGTAPTGMYIKHIQYTHNTTADPQSIIFPSAGNLVVGSTSENNQVVSAVSDTASNSYTIIAPAANHGSIFYVCAATTANTLIVKPTIAAALTSQWFMLYDVVGAATSCADGNTNGSGTQTGAGNISWTPGTAPSVQPGLAIVINGYGTGPASAVTPGVYDCLFYPNEDDTDKTCNGDAFSHLFYSSTSAPAFTWTMANGAGGSAWDTVIAYFKAPATAAVVDSSNGGVVY